jgi:hypothetical protein
MNLFLEQGLRMRKEIYQQKILLLTLKNGESAIVDRDGLKLIISYSDNRAKKDYENRRKGLLKLEKKIKTGKLTKSNINNRGYNKYLKLEGEIEITLDHQKFEDDGAWDGLKGYLTNAKMSKDEIIEKLWTLMANRESVPHQ